LSIDALLQSFAQFGVRLGLESIQQLLKALDNPHEQVPVIHVAGSNGKGSVCAYLSAVLTEAGYTVGRYISPHLVNWTERICLNEQPISEEALEAVLRQVSAIAQSLDPVPTQFEVITAAAWLYFAQQEVDVAIMEVGLGGRLDATNVCDYPLVSIITSISREHWQRLGPTLADIAGEKAGILKPGCPAVIGALPPEAATVIHRRAAELECIATFPPAAKDLGNGWAEYQGIEEYELETDSDDPEEGVMLHLLKTIRYPLPLQGAIQLYNSAVAIAALQLLREQGWQISDDAIAEGMAKTRWPARLQWVEWQGHRLLIDGAHNPASAAVLRQFLDESAQPTTTTDANSVSVDAPAEAVPLCTHFVMGMLSTKDHADVFEALLRSGDFLYLAPVPDHSSAQPAELATLAEQVCPTLARCIPYEDVMAALEAAIANAQPKDVVVLCGSLYLIGHFLSRAVGA
jgi:dihydrofolate synthase / folylpolyglutamate synthase